VGTGLALLQHEEGIRYLLLTDSLPVEPDVRPLPWKGRGHIWSAPYCKRKFVRDKKKSCSHISGLCLRMSNTSGPDGIRASPPHQVFGLTMGPRPQQVLRNAGVTFLPSLELYLRNSLLTFDCLRTESFYSNSL